MARTPDDPLKPQVWVTKGMDDLDFEFYIPQGPKGDPGPFVSTEVLGTSGINLNDLVTPGTYNLSIPSQSADSALRNYPMHEAGSMWVTLSNGGSVIIQQYMTNTKGMYVRRKFSGTWSAWRHFGASRVDQTAGRAMYHWDEVNSRDQLVYGDTGWRDMPLAVPSATGWARLRRFGYMVELSISMGLPDATPGSTDLVVLPDGFKPGSSSAVSFLYARPSASTTQITYGLKPAAFSLQHSTAWNVSWGENRIRHNWLTNDLWPTSLPGAASGSIPQL